ncbi:MAG: hypothetical protein ACI8QZ_003977 [Chlamydiales bacterium]|jgi:hypothetical protein
MTNPATSTTRPNRLRTKKLINWRLQMRLTGWFVAAGGLALGLQYILTVNRLTDIAMEHAIDPGVAFESARSMTQQVLLLSMAVTLPVTTLVGILATSRIAGPLHRLTGFLQATNRGEGPPDCTLREGDQLIPFTELLNDATRLTREGSRSDETEQQAA